MSLAVAHYIAPAALAALEARIEASNSSSALSILSGIMRNGNAAYSGMSLSETFAGALEDLCLLIREHANFYNEPEYPPMLRGSNIQDALAAAHDFYACGEGEP